MLTLTKAETKYWYLTLTEKTTISNPYYLFSLKHRQTNTEYDFILTDVSQYKERYNKFQINESNIDLYEGEYYYTIYAQSSSTNTNPSLANEVVELGIMKLEPAAVTVEQYTPTIIEKIYDGIIDLTYLITQQNDYLTTQDGFKIIL